MIRWSKNIRVDQQSKRLEILLLRNQSAARRRRRKRLNFPAAWQISLFASVTGVITAAAVGVVMSLSLTPSSRRPRAERLIFPDCFVARVQPVLQPAPLITASRCLTEKQQAGAVTLTSVVLVAIKQNSGTEIAAVLASRQPARSLSAVRVPPTFQGWTVLDHAFYTSPEAVM